MKKIILLLLFVFSVSLFAQEIPNAGFENWTDGNPDQWFAVNFPGVAIPVTQSNESHSGSSAVRLEIVDFMGSPFAATVLSINQEGRGFPVTQRHGSLAGYYRFSPQGENDALMISIVLYRNSMSEAVGGGFLSIGEAAGAYTQFVLPIEYFSSEAPDSAIITLAVADSSGGESPGTVGSFAIVDDLSFGAPTAVEDELSLPNSYSLSQNYPNPFNPTTTISYEIPSESFVDLKVYNVLGNEVMTLVNKEQASGKYSVTFDASSLSSGVYFYTLKAGNFKQTSKMILQK